MRIRAVPLLASLALPLLAAPAFAQGFSNYRGDAGQGPYVGFGASQFNYKEEGLATINPGVGTFRFGAYLAPNFAIEGRVGRSIGTTSVDGYGVEVQSLYGGYLKGVVPVTSAFSLYGIAGLTAVQLHRDFGVLRSNDNGFSYGVGAEFNFPNRMILGAEYMRALTGNNAGYSYNADMATIGLAWRF